MSRSYTDLGVIAQHITFDFLEAKAPERDLLVQTAIEPLDLSETMQVTGMMLSMLGDLIDGMTGASPEIEQRYRQQMVTARAGIPPLPSEYVDALS